MPEPRVVVAKSLYSEKQTQTNKTKSLPIDVLGQFMRCYPAYTLDMARKVPHRVLHELIRQHRQQEINSKILDLRIALATLADQDGKLERATDLMQELTDDYERLER